MEDLQEARRASVCRDLTSNSYNVHARGSAREVYQSVFKQCDFGKPSSLFWFAAHNIISRVEIRLSLPLNPERPSTGRFPFLLLIFRSRSV